MEEKDLVRKIGITSRYALNKNKKAIYTTFQKRRRKGIKVDGSGLECCDKKFAKTYKSL